MASPSPTPEVLIISSSPDYAERPLPKVEPPAPDADRGWLVGVWVVVGVFVLIMFAMSYAVDVPVRDPGGSMFARRALLSVGLFAAFAVAHAALRARSDRRRLAGTVARLRARWTVERLAISLSGLLAYHIVYLTYHNIKSWVVFQDIVDDMLLDMDRWLMFGHSPALLLHAVLGQGAAAVVLAIIYEAFSYMVTASFVASMVFPERIRDGYVYLMSAMWAWVLGAFGYYLLPSMGPFAAAPGEFAGLRETFIVSRQANLVGDRAYLLDHPEAHDAFASIGAFPSLHIGFTYMVLLMVRYYGWRWLTQVMWVFLVATIIATIYFGYHYLIDDVAGLVLGYLAVLLGKLLIYPKGRPAEVPRGD